MKNDLTKQQLDQVITVTIPLRAVLRLAELDAQPTTRLELTHVMPPLPAIGSEYEGGIYAGLSLENEQPVALVLLPDTFEGDWNDAKAFAEQRGGVLPSRVDQIVLFKNLKREFKDAWYWSGEEYAGDAGYAWGQHFGDGGQINDRKSDEYLARAVRRVPI